MLVWSKYVSNGNIGDLTFLQGNIFAMIELKGSA